MSETYRYALILLLTAVVGLVAVLSNRLTERLRIPVPVLTLIAAAIAVKAVPALTAPQERTVERIVTVALLCILFDGGLSIGWRRFRDAAGPIVVVGVLGTTLTTAAAAVAVHAITGLSWYLSLLVATAVAPTDPAVVFSVLGQREIAGRSGTILEGESGANDPVGIALMAGLLSAGGLSGDALVHVGGNFVLQMVVGSVVGVVGGRGLLWFMRRVPLPGEGLYPIRTLASVLLLYGVAALAHGSGFLAVFVAAIVIGDAPAPFKTEIARFHKALAGLAEIVAFVVLGLSVDLAELGHLDVWVPGLALGVLIGGVIRPVVVGLCLIPARLRANERTFVLFAGLKGAVPILLGELIRGAHVPHAERLYAIIVVVVIFSVAVQGSLTPVVADRLRIPMHTVPIQPWALGMRLADEPADAHHLTVQPGSIADGSTVRELGRRQPPIWISLVVRDGRLVGVSGGTELRRGDEVLVLADAAQIEMLTALFDTPATGPDT